MPFTPASHTPYQWDNAPATDTPLDSTHLEASEQDLITYIQSVSTSLDSYLEGILAPLASPALTGNPTAPTQSTGDSSTKLATTAFVHNVAATALQDLSVATTGTSSATALAGSINPYNATSGNITATLPTGSATGSLLAVVKTDSSANTVTASGSIRDVGSQSIVLKLQNETILFQADTTGSWWPVANYRDLTGTDARYVQAAAPVLTANEIYPLATPTYGTTVTPNAANGRWQTVTVTNATGFTIAAPTNPPTSSQTEDLIIEIYNNSGGAMGTITWNAVYLFTGTSWTNPANTKHRFARFGWNGANWVAISVASADY